MRSAVRATKQSNQQRSLRSADRRDEHHMETRDVVREKYGTAARRVLDGTGLPADCCSQTSCCEGSATASCDPITSDLYDETQAAQLPDQALKASLGCG